MEESSQIFGPYELVRRLARGGMAEVFLAIERGIEGVRRKVVVKRILPQHAESEEFVAMFMDEARVVARLVHPNIAHVYSFGEVDGVYYLAMEYVDGLTVSRMVKADPARRLPVEHALKVVADVCGGLHHAHELADEEGRLLGVIHRDVSPQNIMVARLGVTKLIDFGVARAATQIHSTGVGQVKGKLAYMAPEQFTGKGIDRRADVFSLGVVLHELITGERLFVRPNEGAILASILHDDIPKVRRLGVPAEVDEILAKALSRSRKGRYATALEMQEDIEELMTARRMVATASALGKLVAERLAILKELRGQDDSSRSTVDSLPSTVEGSPPSPAAPKAPRPPRDSETPAQTRPAVPAGRSTRSSEAEAIDDIEIDLEPTADEEGSSTSGPSEVSGTPASQITPSPASDLRDRRASPMAVVAVVLAFAVGAGLALALVLALTGPSEPGEPAVVSTSPGGRRDVPGPVEDSGPDDATSGPAATDDAGGEASAGDGLAASPGAPDSGPPATEETSPDAGRSSPGGGHDEVRGPPGTLFLGTRPWSKVRIGRRSLGTTPLLGVSVPSGTHTVVLEDARGKQHRRRVRIRPGQATKVFWDLGG